MIREFSAGIIPIRNTSDGRKYLLLKSGLTRVELWEFPKGQIEKGESAKTAAVREFQEETGIPECTLLPDFKKVIRYFYRRGSETIAKTVTYFLAEVKTTRVKISHESTDYEWVTPEGAREFVRHKNILELIDAAEEFLRPLGEKPE